MSLWDKVITQNEIDSALIRNLNDLSYRATKGRRENGRSLKNGIVNIGTLPFLEKPPPDAITKEMILDYQKSLTEPLKDPITGKQINNKYYPSTFAYDVSDITTPPTPINEFTLGKPAVETDIDKYQKELKDGIAKLEKGRVDLKKEETELVKMKDTLNYGIPSTDADGNPIRSPLSSAEQTKLETDVADKDRDIRSLKRDLTQFYTDNGNIKKILMSIKQNIEDNKNLIIQHKKSIVDNLAKYRENLIRQNQNKMVIEEQLPNETQEEYLLRMKDMESELFDMNLYEEKANLHQVQMLKKNLRQIFSNDAMIENIVKSFKEEQRFIINKHFPEIAEYILDTYGKNNTNLSLEDVVEVITSHLERNPLIEYKINEDEIVSSAPAATSFINVLDGDVMLLMLQQENQSQQN